MSTMIGTAHVFGLTGGTIAIPILTGYVTPNMQSLRVSHGAEIDQIRDQGGDTTGLIASDEMLEIEFEIVPESATIANALKSAGIPPSLSKVEITGLPIHACGPFANALNTNGSGVDAAPWIYLVGGTKNGPHNGKWSLTLPCKRWPKILNATVIAA